MDLAAKMRVKLVDREEWVTIYDLVHEFGAAARTVRSAIAKLKSLQLLDEDWDGRRKLYRLRRDAGLRSLCLEHQEAFALRKILMNHRGEAVDSVAAKLEHVFFGREAR